MQLAASPSKERVAIGFPRELAIDLFGILINHPLAVRSVRVFRILTKVRYAIGVVGLFVIVNCGDFGLYCEVAARLVRAQEPEAAAGFWE
ncbi:hypothetical protein PAPB9_02445 [Pseudomonas aeruginosa]|nr:hypothetical protein PAPB9_02445 [Pseudomonas aeruginosa]KRU82890.1 hypothetical protein AN453_28095 [Pseudomonas aeruginosa]